MNHSIIKNAKLGETLKDSQISGLSVRVRKTGISFMLYYRTKQGKERRPKIGGFPLITLDQARKIAKDILLRVAMGEDPMQDREDQRTAPTVSETWVRYESEHAETKKTGGEDKRVYQKSVPEWFKKMQVENVVYNDIYKMHQDLKTTPYQANRVLSMVSKFFNLCERWGLRKQGTNPCQHVPRFKEESRRRYMTSDESSTVYNLMLSKKNEHPASIAFIMLLILTGARKGELAGARWNQLKGNKIILSEHKTDHTGDDRVIHLSKTAIEIINELPRGTEDSLILGMKSPRRLWESIRAEAGCPDLRLHDLRHSFASVAISSGYNLSQIGELLGHREADTTKRYAHLMDDSAKSVTEDIAESITSRMKNKA